MMRSALFCWLVIAAAGVSVAQDKDKEKKVEIPKDLEPFQGSWRMVKLQIRGDDNPKGGPSIFQRFTFTGDKVTVKEVDAEQFAGTFTVDPKKDPAEMDFVDAKGERTRWIYKFDKDGKLSLCFEFSFGKDSVRPKSFETKGTSSVLFVLEKVKE